MNLASSCPMIVGIVLSVDEHWKTTKKRTIMIIWVVNGVLGCEGRRGNSQRSTLEDKMIEATVTAAESVGAESLRLAVCVCAAVG